MDPRSVEAWCAPLRPRESNNNGAAIARAGAVLAAAVLFGCGGSDGARYDRLSAALREASAPAAAPAAGGAEVAAPVAGATLEREPFVRAVLASNPNVEAARHGFRAALAQYPQSTALADPMLEYSVAPLSIGSDDVAFGQTITLSQRIPWPGKRALAGEIALAEAEAAREDYEVTRRRLALMASTLFDQYFVAARSLELNAEHARLAEDLRAAAQAQYQAGRASQQEPLQADLELSQVERERVLLLAQRGLIEAQMNGLLHRSPDAPLPPPPAELQPASDEVAPSAALHAQALAQRPELRQLHAQERGRASAIALAERQYYPDLGVMASYSSMWAHTHHQWMVGVSLSIPIQFDALDAAVEQAQAWRAQAASLQLATDDEVRVQAEQARQRLLEAEQLLALYTQRLLPATRAQIDAARIDYETGRSSFQALVDAMRSVRRVELEHQQALAQHGQRVAELQHAIGSVPGLPQEEVRP